MDKIIYASAVLQCDPHQAFEFFTVSKRLEQWLTEVADVDPVVGGKYELFWNPKDRENDSTIGCSITALVQDKILSFEWKGPQQYKHFANNADPLTHVTICLIPEGTYTHVHLIHSGWRSTQEWEEMRVWFEKVWKLAFSDLEVLIQDINRIDAKY